MLNGIWMFTASLLGRAVGEELARRRRRKLASNRSRTSGGHERERARDRHEARRPVARGGDNGPRLAGHDPEEDQSARRGQSAPSATSRDPLAEHFATLGLDPGATLEQIKAAHRRLALQFHPDRLPEGASEAVRDLVKAKMQALNIARDILIASRTPRTSQRE
jgi:hypothetical protein